MTTTKLNSSVFPDGDVWRWAITPEGDTEPVTHGCRDTKEKAEMELEAELEEYRRIYSTRPETV